jgi:hypothetical protein
MVGSNRTHRGTNISQKFRCGNGLAVRLRQQAMQARNRFDPTRRVEQNLTYTFNARCGGRIPGFQPGQVADRSEAVGDPVIGLANRKISGSLGDRDGVHEN